MRAQTPPIILNRPQKIALAAIALVWLITMFGGGSARFDVLYIVPVRLAALAAIALLLLLVPREQLRLQRAPLIFTAAVATVIACQLIPLPPSLWTSLPGRQVFQTLASESDIGDVWRPISLSPDLTWNALLSLIPPLFFLVAVPMIPRRLRARLLTALLATILLSGLVGMLQIAGGPNSPLRYYHYTNNLSATGLFANRNHEAVFLAMGIPLTVWWALLDSGPMRRQSRFVIAACFILFLLTAAVTTGSRMGAVTVVLSLILSVLYFFRQVPPSRATIALIGGGSVVTMILAAAALDTWSRSRLESDAMTSDLRLRILPDSLHAAAAYFPFGAGFGAFPDAFPRFESVQNLDPSYVNHTHCELTELLIEGGVAAMLLLLLFLGWFLVAAWRAWTRKSKSGSANAEVRLATILMALPLVASITDYPLRTPLMACSFAAAAAILAAFQLDTAPARQTADKQDFHGLPKESRLGALPVERV